MHSQLVLADTHGQRPLLGLLCGHKAAVYVLVEPGVVTGGQVCHNRGKLDGPLDPCPVKQEMLESLS